MWWHIRNEIVNYLVIFQYFYNAKIAAFLSSYKPI